MSLIATALKHMLAAGMSADAIVAAVEAMESSLPSSPVAGRSAETPGAERMRRYRERRRQSGLDPNFDGGRYAAALRERDGSLCVYCDAVDGNVVDHMLPVSQGGTDDLDNLALACGPCNCGKAGRLLSSDGREIASPTARASYVRYVRERVRGVPDGSAPVPRTGTQVVTPSLPSLRSEELAVVVGECAGERVQVDDWPTGKASDHADLLIAAVASPWLDPSKSQDLVTTRGRLAAWKRDGASWEHDVLPVVAGLAAKRHARIGTWKYFDAAISQSIADNRAALEIPEAGTVIRLHATGPPRTIDEKSSAAWDYAERRIAEDG